MAGLYQKMNSCGVLPRAVLSTVTAALLLSGGLLTLANLWGTAVPPMLLPGIMAALGWGSWLYSAHPGRRAGVRWGLRLAPWLVVLLYGTVRCWQGALYFLNGIISAWNTLHRGGVRLFDVYAEGADVLAATLAAALLLGQLVADMQFHRRIWGGILLAGALLLPQLLTQTLSPWACALYLSGLLSCWLTLPGQKPLPQSLRMAAVCMAVLFLCAAFVPAQPMHSMQVLRSDITEEVHLMRYGRETLPLGEIEKAASLHESGELMLTLSTEQEKDLYLNGFVGGEYANGAWQPLPDSAYSGEFDGMLDWLSSHGFSPQSQTALYHSLSQQSDPLVENHIFILNQSACRSMIYAPYGTEQIELAHVTRKLDTRFAPGGLWGAQKYRLKELSSARPAELTVRENWVTDPETDEQRQYCEAEAVYRNFVYENYLAVEPSLADTIDRLFWQDYEPQSEGVYSAVDHIRQVLRAQTQYGTPTVQGSMQGFLAGLQPGNAVYYATAAVQALRARGIPARYAEGYYVSASAVQKAGGTVAVTGQEAHAWAEVYFDGVGWLPVDMTPGYYRDAVTLQQMVAMPDGAHKTAALQDDAPGAEDLLKNGADTGLQLPDLPKTALRVAAVVLGAAALLMLLALAALLVLELVRWGTWRYKTRCYAKAGPMQKAYFLHNRLRNLGAVWGVDCRLGWHTAQTDAALAEAIESVRPGEYTRAAQLLERFLYGGEQPMPYELHTIEVLIAKLSNPEGMSKKRYWQMRVCHMQWLPVLRKAKKA